MCSPLVLLPPPLLIIIAQSLKQANKFQATIKFTAENFQTTKLLSSKQWCLKRNDSNTNPCETLKSIAGRLKPFNIYTSTDAVKNAGFIKDKTIRLLRTNSSKTFEESLEEFKQRLRARGYPKKIIERCNFASEQSAFTQKKKTNEHFLPYITTYHPSVKNLKKISAWSNEA